MESRLAFMERKMDSFLKTQETVMQTLSRLGDQMSQLANPVSERQQGTLPSQPLPYCLLYTSDAADDYSV